jgi:hypothetical protein
VPRPSESSPEAFSSAELNPLLNPVLGEHMGLWAEVYFTNPPEKRDAAVLDLLHELQAGTSPAKKTGYGIAREIKTAPWPGASSPAGAAKSNQSIMNESIMIEEPPVKCSSCGHGNPPLHRFCGDCGAPLADPAPNPSTSAAERLAEPNSRTETSAAPQQSAGSETFRETSVEEIRSRLDSQRREFEDSIAHPQELSLFRSFREQDSGDDDWNERSPHRRFYFFALLAILVAGAIYMAWRSGQLSAQRGRDAQPAVSPAAKGSSTPGSGTANEPDASQQANKAVTPAAKQPAVQEEAKTASPVPATDARAKTIQRVSSAKIEPIPAPPIPADNGAEELAVAQRYLNGSNGQRRDSVEAAKWLWKSISKHNGEASVLLADLYLKGDGVSKNCDQARVLLDTAGRKGVPGAGMRLRNLPAFGCQ